MRSCRVAATVLVAIAAACGGGSESGTNTKPATQTTPAVTTVTLTPSSSTLEIGGSASFTAEVRDQFGAVMVGQSVTWSSSDANIASVSSGAVTAKAVGTASITAAVGGKSGSALVTVIQPAVASLTIAGVGGSITTGQSVQLTATTKDKNSNVLTGRSVAWTSSASSIATVDAAGKVTGLAPGSATITATSEGISATVSVSVTGNPITLPTITSVSPATLSSGGQATISGFAFDAALANNTVSIGGVAAQVTAATATSISVIVPCLLSGNTTVQVTSATKAGPAFNTTVATPKTSLAVGAAAVLSDPTCNELTASGNARYVVSVFTTAGTPNSSTDFELAGNPVAAGPAPLFAPSRSLSPVVVASNVDASRDRAHFQMLEQNRATFLEGMRRMARLPAASRALLSSATQAPVPQVGDRRVFYNEYSSSGCADTTVTARMYGKVIYVGTKAVIWEDTTNTLLSSSDPALLGYYQRLGQIFDQDQYDVIKNNFADPLLRDAVTDADGRVHMVFSQKINGTGAAAYVNYCDQFPTTVFTASNYNQVFYGTVPTTSGTNINSTAFPDGWFNFMARTVVHEVKHIASASSRASKTPINFEESWLEEGLARHAEEMWVRQYLHKVQWKGNTGFGTAATNGVFCDFHGESAQCNSNDALRRPDYGMRRHFNEILPKLQQPWNWSIYGDGSGQTGSVFYQTTWSFARYAIDRFGTSDAQFLGALTNSTATGLANLSAVAGVSGDQLFGLWTLAMYADDWPGLTSPSTDVQFPTWNLRNIYASLSTDNLWASRFPQAFPFTSQALNFGAFTAQRTGLRGGANAYFELSGTAAVSQVLNVRAIGGGTAPAGLRIAIARLQ